MIDGFQTRIWGPAAWLFLHCIAGTYNPDRKNSYKLFFTLLKDVLPCGACRNNYRKIIETKFPLTDEILSSTKNLENWLFNVHRQVQKDIYKKTQFIKNDPENKSNTFYRQFYEQFRAKCIKDASGCEVPYTKGLKRMSTIYIEPFKSRKTGKSIVYVTKLKK